MEFPTATCLAGALLALTLSACAAVPRVRVVPPPDASEVARAEAAVAALRSSVPVDAFAPGCFTRPGGGTIPYRLLRPAELVAGRRYPLVVIFHGSGAIGTDNTSQIGPLAKSWASPLRQQRYPAFVLVPQFSTRSSVYENAGTPAATSTATESLRDALALVRSLKSELPVDASRICTIGFSMGGSAVWNALVLEPGLFSAAVIVAGVPNRDALARLGTTRLLLVHGDADTENPFTATRAAYETAPSRGIEFWQYRALAHDFPPDLIAEDDLARWLFGAR
jgi:predicted peptidase